MWRQLARSLHRDLKRPLFWLGAVLPVCFIAGITGATIPTQMPLLSVVLAIWWLRAPHAPIDIPVLGAMFLVYAALSLLWAVNPRDSAFGLWQVALWALGFWLGSTSPSLSPLWRGMAIGLGISSAVAIAQAAGWSAIPSYDHPAGLLYSGSVQGAMIALVTLALICDRAWLYIPAMLPGLYLAQSRGAWVVLAIGLVARLHWIPAALSLLGAGAIVLVHPSQSDSYRLVDWTIAAHALSLFGSGIGSFIDVLYNMPGQPAIHPLQVHNDYLQLAFELGIGAIPLYLVFALCLARIEARYWTVFFGFATLGLFYFPLYCASLAFVGTVVAGNLLRDDGGAWLAGNRSRLDIVAWLFERERRHGADRRPPIPDLPGIAAAQSEAVNAAF